jgi:hypothetical protein
MEFGVLKRRRERRAAAVDLVSRREAIPVASDGGCGEGWTAEWRSSISCVFLDETA